MLSLLLQPGTRLMRRLRLHGKVGLLAAVLVGALALGALPWLAGAGAALPAAGAAVALYLAMCLYSSLAADLQHLSTALGGMAQGQLGQASSLKGADELADLSRLVGKLSVTLSGVVADVRSNSALVAQAGHVLATGNRDLAGRTEQQAANLEQTSASVQQLASTVQQNASSASEVDRQTGGVRDAAETGSRSMSQAVESVEAIQASARRMAEITGVIDGIAFQTNILALNAAVEAARAGEQGRGFAVVAAEVRRLAQRSGDAAKEIRELIATSLTQVDSSVERMRAADGGITSIVDGVRGVAANMSHISRASAEQSVGLQQISAAVSQLDTLTQRNAQLVEQAVSHAGRLEERAATLSRAVGHFRLDQGTADEALALVGRALEQSNRMDGAQFARWLTDKASGCCDRDMYVFALDGGGTYCAFAGNPAKVGTRVQDIPGVQGEQLLRTIVNQAEEGPGWVEYDITNPQTGVVQTKMSYVVKAGGLYLGCGVYKSLVLKQAA